jgi:valyl-tRNA synthetase
MTLEKQFNPLEFESACYKKWQDMGAFEPQEQTNESLKKPNKPPYCIMLPPPNVTGVLHMGHAFQQTVMDILIRYHRMQGHKTLWQPGTDHASIATQLIVERQLQQQGIHKESLGREKFLEKVWEWKEISGNTIVEQMKRLGASADWSRLRFTLDADLSAAVQKVFIDLYDEGLIYRGKRLVNWDPVLQTAISDLEVIPEETQGSLWHIRYPGENGTQGVIVATTRPETLLGDVAVAVHPDDERYQSLIGHTVQLPLCDRSIPVIADESVDPTFGTGCVKITPAHDFNDYAMGMRHKLPLINILNKDATINTQAPKAYQGLSREAARAKVLEDLIELGLLVDTEPHALKIPRGEKSGEIIEPLLTDQWFVNTKEMAEKAKDVVENGEIQFVPENWKKTYDEWMKNIQDWCISRQLWWGHRIPAWYDEQGQIYVGTDEASIRKEKGLGADVVLTQDPDVLDTWFSSALWPFSTLGWPEKTQELEDFYPGAVLVTGFDIIFFWVARMIMFGLKFTGKIPFEKVYIHGLVQDAYGQKMSKSKGNVIDPLDLIDGIDLESLVAKRTKGLMQPHLAKKIEKDTRATFPNGIPAFGTDALRFTFAALASNNRFIRFDLNRVDGYRNFCNKLWNAARYVLMNTVSSEGEAIFASEKRYFDPPRQLTLVDQWILTEWQRVKADIERELKNYRFDLAAQHLYDFVWKEYCDWYLELSKPVLTKTGQFTQDEIYGTRHTLLTVLEEVLRVLHPFMPFITEHMWHKVAPYCVKNYLADQTIMLQAYPEPDEAQHYGESVIKIRHLKQLIEAVRQTRSQNNIPPKTEITLLFRNDEPKEGAQDRKYIKEVAVWLNALLKVKDYAWLEKDEADPQNAQLINLGPFLKAFLPMAGLIDIDKEKSRLQKEIEKAEKEARVAEQKLANPNYVDKAPPAVVAQERERLLQYQATLRTLEQRLKQLV